MGTLIIIPGLSSSTKRPGFYGETKYGNGPLAIGSIPLNLLLVGNKTSAGSMTADGSPVQVFGSSEVDALAGAGSELAAMAYGEDRRSGAMSVPGINVWLGCVAENGSGTYASATITFSNATASSTGTIYYSVLGVKVPLTVAIGDTGAQAATALAALINSKGLQVTAAAGGTGGRVVTLTARNVGPRANWFTLLQDTSSGPGTITSTLAGGTALTGGGVHFTGGAGADDPTNLIAAIASQQFDVIALACGDATTDAISFALWKAAVNAAAGATVGILEHVVTASTDTLTNAASVTKTTLNDARFFLVRLLNGETPASVMAATLAANIVAIQQGDPGAGTQYAGLVLQGVAPQTQAADKSTNGVVETALGEGVTELVTNPDGTVAVTRLITTRCLNGATPDYRTFDACDSFVPDYCRAVAKLGWISEFQPDAPRVAPDVPVELKQPPSGVATPKAWADWLTAKAYQFERGENLPGPPILINVANNLPTAQWNAAGRFIVSAWPVEVAPPNLIVGCSVRQVSSAA